MTTAPFTRVVGASRPQAPFTTPLERSARGSARRVDGEETERSGVPQPLAPLRGVGGVVGLAAGREEPRESRSGQTEEPTGLGLGLRRDVLGEKWEAGEPVVTIQRRGPPAGWELKQLCVGPTIGEAVG